MARYDVAMPETRERTIRRRIREQRCARPDGTCSNWVATELELDPLTHQWVPLRRGRGDGWYCSHRCRVAGYRHRQRQHAEAQSG